MAAIVEATPIEEGVPSVGSLTLSDAAPVDETPKHVAFAAEDQGRKNREQWHWQETDLAEWIDEWLALNLKDHVFLDDPSLTCKVYSFRRTDGEALLHQRKGKTFCTFNVALKIGFYAQQLLDGRVIAESRGRVLIPELSSDDSAGAFEATVDGDWEECAPDMPLAQHIKRDPTPFEVAIKRAVVAAACAPAAAPAAPDDTPAAPDDDDSTFRGRLEALRRDLDALAAQKDAAAAAGSATLPRPARRGPVPPPAGSEAGEAAEAAARAKESAAAYVADLKKTHRNPRIGGTLDPGGSGAGATEWALAYVGLEDADVPDLVAALKRKGDGGAAAPDADFAARLEKLHLSGNRLTDAGAQKLLLALACGAAPKLALLDLTGNAAIGEVAKRQAGGLKLMRKTLDVAW